MLLYHGSTMAIEKPQLVEQQRGLAAMNSISPVIAMITPGILSLLMENRKVSLEEASALLYNSRLYRVLEDDKTKVWRLGYPLLYDLLDEELATGEITFPEEQC